MRRVGAPVPSPDGQRLVFPVAMPAYEAKVQASDLWLAPVDGSADPRQITHDKAAESGVAWSPDSTRIAFSAQRQGDEAAQIYVIDLAAGGEARRITDVVTGARQPRWSPERLGRGAADHGCGDRRPPAAVEPGRYEIALRERGPPERSRRGGQPQSRPGGQGPEAHGARPRLVSDQVLGPLAGRPEGPPVGAGGQAGGRGARPAGGHEAGGGTGFRGKAGGCRRVPARGVDARRRGGGLCRDNGAPPGRLCRRAGAVVPSGPPGRGAAGPDARWGLLRRARVFGGRADVARGPDPGRGRQDVPSFPGRGVPVAV